MTKSLWETFGSFACPCDYTESENGTLSQPAKQIQLHKALARDVDFTKNVLDK